MGLLDHEDQENGSASATSVLQLTTSTIGQRERGEFWRHVVSENFVDVEFTSKVAPDFAGTLVSRKVGELTLSTIETDAHAVRSSFPQARSCREQSIFAVLMLSGQGWFEQDAREVYLAPGDLTFHDAARPHQFAFSQRISMLFVRLSRPRLADLVAGLEHCTARRIAGSGGIGAVVSSYLCALSAQAMDSKLSNHSELAECTTGLLAAALSTVRPGGTLQSRSRALSLYRVKEYIEHHLADPTLDTKAISIGVGLSARYINKLFDEENCSSSLLRYVWSRRLEHCRRDLSDPAHLGHRVSEIALRWGFNDLSHFSRAFKSRFGVAPREFRDQSVGAALRDSKEVHGTRPAIASAQGQPWQRLHLAPPVS